MIVEFEINKNLLTDVETVSKELGVNKNTLVSMALKRYLHLLQMQIIRKDLKGVARKKGFRSEKDVFKSIS